MSLFRPPKIDLSEQGEAKTVLKVPVHTTKLEKTLEQERKRNNHMMFDTFDLSGDGQLDPDGEHLCCIFGRFEQETCRICP